MSIPDYRLEPPDYEPIGRCSECGEEFSCNEDFYEIDDETLCEECFHKYILDAIEQCFTASELADKLGIEYRVTNAYD